MRLEKHVLMFVTYLLRVADLLRTAARRVRHSV